MRIRIRRYSLGYVIGESIGKALMRLSPTQSLLQLWTHFQSYVSMFENI
jgi:hypothetical protein